MPLWRDVGGREGPLCVSGIIPPRITGRAIKGPPVCTAFAILMSL